MGETGPPCRESSDCPLAPLGPAQAHTFRTSCLLGPRWLPLRLQPLSLPLAFLTVGSLQVELAPEHVLFALGLVIVSSNMGNGVNRVLFWVAPCPSPYFSLGPCEGRQGSHMCPDHQTTAQRGKENSSMKAALGCEIL